jgi:hypothetical protein
MKDKVIEVINLNYQIKFDANEFDFLYDTEVDDFYKIVIENASLILL